MRQNGTRFWANVVITALRDADGTLRGYGKITRDLTERRTAELKLRVSEERFRLMVEGVADYAIFMLDPAGYVTTWNAGAERFKGYRADDIIGRHFSVFYPAEDVAAGKPENELAIAAAEGRIADEGWRVGQNGTGSGQTSSLRHCATRMERCAATARSRAISPNAEATNVSSSIWQTTIR